MEKYCVVHSFYLATVRAIPYGSLVSLFHCFSSPPPEAKKQGKFIKIISFS